MADEEEGTPRPPAAEEDEHFYAVFDGEKPGCYRTLEETKGQRYREFSGKDAFERAMGYSLSGYFGEGDKGYGRDHKKYIEKDTVTTKLFRNTKLVPVTCCMIWQPTADDVPDRQTDDVGFKYSIGTFHIMMEIVKTARCVDGVSISFHSG